MDFTIDQITLEKSLSLVAKAAATVSTLPVLSHVLIRASSEDQTLAFSTTNQSISACCRVSAFVGESGSLTVPVGLLLDWIKKLPSIQMVGHGDLSINRLTLKGGRYRSTFNGIEADQFPELSSDAEYKSFLIPHDTLARIFELVGAAATDDASMPPAYAGINIKISGGKIRWAATDSFRLAFYLMDYADPSVTADFTLPKTSLSELVRIMKESDVKQPVEVRLYENKAVFCLSFPDSPIGSLEFSSQLLIFRFPNIEGFVPKSMSISITADTRSLIRDIGLAMIYAKDNHNRVRMTAQVNPDPDGFSLLGISSLSESGEHVSEIDCSMEGSDLALVINGMYLLDVLRAVKTERVTIKAAAANKPLIVEPDSSEPYIHVLTPMIDGKK